MEVTGEVHVDTVVAKSGSRALVRRTGVRPAAALLVLALLGVPAPAVAGQGGDLADELAQAERAAAEAGSILENATEQAQEAAQRFAAAEAELPATQLRWDEARGLAAAARTEASAAAAAAEQARAALTAAAQQVEGAAAAVEQARGQVDAFVVAAYKGSGMVAFNMLLDARGPVEAAERFGYLDQIVAAERAVVDELTTARLSARHAENGALLAADAAERARQAAQDAQVRAEAAEQEAQRAAQAAQDLLQQREESLAVAESERAESLRRYEQAEAEAARVAAELRAWEAAQRAAEAPAVPAPSGGGAMLLMPTQGWKSSAFGMRFDPFFRVWQMHAGVDIAANGGTPIRAAAGGTVVWAGWHGGYGLHTCVSHGSYQGQALSTCYAHQSEILVTPGQQVRRGELIGRVGTTGASTGNHLHFEVRLDGAPTDPLRYLPRCLC